MDAPMLVWGAKEWAGVATGAALVLLVLLAIGYWRIGSTPALKFTAATLKTLAIIILAICLVEPLLEGKRARPGANQFVLLADDSQSMTLKDGEKTRAEELKTTAGKKSSWIAQLGKDFDLRQYAFDAQLRNVDEFDSLSFAGQSSDLGTALERLARRYQGQPLAGIMLLTDGGATDVEAIERLLEQKGAGSSNVVLPPIYPVVFGKSAPPTDISLERVEVTQTNFEDAPVTISAHLITTGARGRTIAVELLDEKQTVVESQKLSAEQDGQPMMARFKVKPEKPGISFYTVRAAIDGMQVQFKEPEKTTEATLANNSRIAVVDRGRGPYRVLYVAGRPNWEYKFMQRGAILDEQVQLVGLIRIAKREPRFAFLGRPGDKNNPLFGGFVEPNKEDVEQYDQPVFKQFGTADEKELKTGFPRTAEELFKFHAIILDDVESEFFSTDQLQLVKDFVRQRGGGLMMMGGEESFKNGKFDRTPIGDLLPVYADQVQELPVDARYEISLTKEGLLEPWLRLRTDEASEKARLESMAKVWSINPIRGIKPGATVLARATAPDGVSVPALVEQRFGQGRAAAMLVGDLWKWEMNRPSMAEPELEKSWRQTIRWLVGEVPGRVELSLDPQAQPDDPKGALRLIVQVRDPAYLPLDNATVNVHIKPPDGEAVEMRAQASSRQPGRYEAMYIPHQPGAYLAAASAAGPDGKQIGDAQAGWTADPAAEEFRDLQPNTALLERLAKATGGEVVRMKDVSSFVESLPTRHAQVTEPYVQPLWHHSWVFLIAIGCLAGEWGLRRLRGLP